MSDALTRYCPCCGRTVVLSGISVSCGKCALVASVSEAKETWPEEPEEWLQ